VFAIIDVACHDAQGTLTGLPVSEQLGGPDGAGPRREQPAASVTSAGLGPAEVATFRR